MDLIIMLEKDNCRQYTDPIAPVLYRFCQEMTLNSGF